MSGPRTPISLDIALHYNGNGAARAATSGAEANSGAESVAKTIATARQHNVPLQEDTALIATLSSIDPGLEIPRQLLIAAAQVLAFAWAVAGKGDAKNMG